AGFDPNGGGFAEYVRAMPWIVEGGMIALPRDVTFEEATFVEPVNTCLKAIRKARVAAGETVLVIGQGPIGMLLAILSKHEGARVYTSDPMAGRRAASLRFGAAESFDPGASSLQAEIRRRTGSRGADAVLLAAPSPALVPEALSIARPGGRVLLFAHNDPVLQLNFPAAAVGIEEKEILGSYSASLDEQEESSALVFSRKLPLAQLISHRFPLERIADALDLAAHPKQDTLKVAITHE
ncbi:MAG TPA: zinc-binding dehydrogenase, partial [Verrucomicrobiae bacterium]|nr:zinc-binding dehydrogenase [Verrucomicrobiae bacterium]